jgi:hypothetical protein
MEDWQDFSHVLQELKQPVTSGFVYRLTDEDDEIVYIGQTKQSVLKRLASHQIDLETIVKVEAKEVPVEQLDFIEGVEVHTYYPYGNRTCPLKLGGIRVCNFYTGGKSKLPSEEELDALFAAREARLNRKGA